MNVFDVRVAWDNTGPHLEYYETEEDFENGFGYPVNEIEDLKEREKLLFDIRNGKFANKR
jgi:hypothetical protein